MKAITKKRLGILAQALRDEHRLKQILPGGFDLSVGLIRRKCGSAGCIAGMAWVLATRSQAKEAEPGYEPVCPSYWGEVEPIALKWLGISYREWKESVPLFATYGETQILGVPPEEISPEQAADAIEEVIRAGDFYHNPWPAVLGDK